MNGLNAIFKGRWTIWIMSLVLALFAGFGVLMIVGQAADQATYYVLKSDVAARTLIKMDMLTPVSTSATGVPPTALSLDTFATGNLFTKIALKRGDVVTTSVVGQWERLSANLPDGFMLASVQVSPENAVGGRIKAGDYIEIASMSSGNKSLAKIVLHHVLVLDVTVAPGSVANAANSSNLNQSGTGPDSPSIYNGIPQMYTLAVNAQDFLTLAAIKESSLYLGLSSKDASGPLSASLDTSNLYSSDPVADSGAGTENVFGTSKASK